MVLVTLLACLIAALLVDRRGEPAVIIMRIRDYIKNIAPTPAAYKAIRDEAKRKGTSSLSMRDIDREIAAVRASRTKTTKKKRKQSAL